MTLMRMDLSIMKTTVTWFLVPQPMTAKAVLIQIQMVGLTPMKVGPQTMEQMLSLPNLVNG